MSPFSRISVVSCENYMIAAGTQEGLIAIFQIPRNIPEASEFPFLGPSFGEFQRSKKVIGAFHLPPISSLLLNNTNAV